MNPNQEGFEADGAEEESPMTFPEGNENSDTSAVERAERERALFNENVARIADAAKELDTQSSQGAVKNFFGRIRDVFREGPTEFKLDVQGELNLVPRGQLEEILARDVSPEEKSRSISFYARRALAELAKSGDGISNSALAEAVAQLPTAEIDPELLQSLTLARETVKELNDKEHADPEIKPDRPFAYRYKTNTVPGFGEILVAAHLTS